MTLTTYSLSILWLLLITFNADDPNEIGLIDFDEEVSRYEEMSSA